MKIKIKWMVNYGWAAEINGRWTGYFIERRRHQFGRAVNASRGGVLLPVHGYSSRAALKKEVIKFLAPVVSKSELEFVEVVE